jgi:GTP diphosphokinase / guanosine-3',5'-bis(diphosphate) 3'-diphosphatase
MDRRLSWSFDFQVNRPLEFVKDAFQRAAAGSYTPRECEIIEGSLSLGERAHEGQMRADGSPYIIHPIRTALLAIWLANAPKVEVIIGCLLHDILEDTWVTERDIEHTFGQIVAGYVRGVTRYREGPESPELRFQRKLDKWKEIMSSSWEIRMIKTSDFCDNVISWKFIGASSSGYKKIPRWLKEAQEIYLPLAKATSEEAASLLESEISAYLRRGFDPTQWTGA